MVDVAIIDYGSGNLHSALKAVRKAASYIGKESDSVQLIHNPDSLDSVSHIILPGVGAFQDCMAGVNSIDGMREALEHNVVEKGKYFLGICVGMQLLAEKGLEDGMHQGFGWLSGEVTKIKPKDKSLKIPHMGWNQIEEIRPNPLTEGLNGKDFYFVHSYAMETGDENIIANTDYAGNIVAAVNKDNIFGTQFHPEKSQENGLKLLTNFISLK